MYKYQNVSDREQVITGDGNITPRVVKAGGEVVSSVPIENPNFHFVGTAEDNGVKAVVTEEQNNAVVEVSPINNTNEEIQ